MLGSNQSEITREAQWCQLIAESKVKEIHSALHQHIVFTTLPVIALQYPL